MRMLLCLLVLVVPTSQATATHSRDRKQECAEVKARIRDVQARMREGYTAKQGVRLERRLRRLRERRARLCR